MTFWCNDPSISVYFYIINIFLKKNKPGKALAKLKRVSCQKTRASRTVYISSILKYCPTPPFTFDLHVIIDEDNVTLGYYATFAAVLS